MSTIAVDFEALSERYTAATIDIMETMLEMVKDPTIDAKERLGAAKRFDSLSTNIMMANMTDKHINSANSSNRQLTQQLGKLTDKFKRDEE